MKKIFILLSILCAVNLKAQKQGEYIPRPEIDKFVGTWEWTSGDEKFQIVITKQKLQKTVYRHPNKITYYSDDVVGWHIYTKANKTVSTSMDKVNTKFVTSRDADKSSGFLGGPPKEQKYLFMTFNDVLKNKWGKVTLTMMSGKTNEARWILREKEDGDIRLVFPGDPVEAAGFSVPTDVIMKKIK